MAVDNMLLKSLYERLKPFAPKLTRRQANELLVAALAVRSFAYVKWVDRPLTDEEEAKSEEWWAKVQEIAKQIGVPIRRDGSLMGTLIRAYPADPRAYDNLGGGIAIA